MLKDACINRKKMMMMVKIIWASYQSQKNYAKNEKIRNCWALTGPN